MPGHMTGTVPGGTEHLSSSELAGAIRGTDFHGAAATIVGFGGIGREYLKALRALGVPRVRVCSRSPEPLAALAGVDGVTTVAGGYERLDVSAAPQELAIVATPAGSLAPAADHLSRLGYRRILVEKPVALIARDVGRLAETMEARGVDAFCAYNRVAYPAFHEVASRVQREGGITSCTYTFTEFVHRIGPDRFSMEELNRWGIANSLHVMSMAHGLIGLPGEWRGYRAGEIAWHPTGAVFVGAGISIRGIPFAYHADWGSTGRWSVEVHTAHSSYRFLPLEQVFRRTGPTAPWDPVPVAAAFADTKPGFAEQVAAALDERLRRHVPLVSLRGAAELARYAQSVFGYGG